MTTCEMCGSDTNSKITIKVAGSIMSVCNSCRNIGNQVQNNNKSSHTFRRNIREKSSEEVISNFQSEIQKGMNRKSVDIHQLARVINLKESTLTNYLKGKIKPAISDAKKIQNFLEINLVEEVISNRSSNEDFISDESSLSSSSLSLGDLIKQQLDKK